MSEDGWKPALVARARRKEAAKDEVLALVAGGWMIKDALSKVGRSRQAYEKWRKEDPRFRDRMLAARAGRDDSTLAGMDFVRFRKLYLDRETPLHHLRMIEAIESAEPDSITMILAPPEAAKTSLMTDYYNYLLGPVDPNFRIAVISEGRDLATKIVGQVKQRMVEESMFGPYINQFGPFRSEGRDSGKPWNANFFTVSKAKLDEKEFSLEARGAGSTLYGGRFDLIVLDDIQSDRNLNSTQQLLNYIRQTVLTRPARGKGRTIIVGTRVGVGDIYETMLDEDMVDNLIQIPALSASIPRDEMFVKVGKRVELVGGVEERVESYWPEYWPLIDLAKRRQKVGEEVWQRVYMQRPADGSLVTFPEKALEDAKDRSRTIDGALGGSLGVMNVFGVDPAIGGWAGLVAAAYTPDKLYLLDCENIKGLSRTEELLDLVSRFATLWRPSVGVFEVDGYGKGLANDDRLAVIASRLHFDVIPHETRRRKADPVMGVASMASAFLEGEISVPWGDERSRVRFAELFEELRRWRPDVPARLLRQDLVMALWFVWRHWQQWRQTIDAPQVRLWRPAFSKRSA